MERKRGCSSANTGQIQMATPSQDTVSQASSGHSSQGWPPLCHTAPSSGPLSQNPDASSSPAPAPSQDHKEGSWDRGSGQREASGTAWLRGPGTRPISQGPGPFAKSPRFEGLGILVKPGRQQRGPGLHDLIQAPWEGRNVRTNGWFRAFMRPTMGLRVEVGSI